MFGKYLTVRRIILNTLPFLLIVYGCLQSLCVSLSVWHIDPDISIIPLLLNNVHKNGFSFLGSFHFPLDNWLFTILLPDALFLHVFGETPRVMMMTGVVVFWVAAILAGGVVGYAAGKWKGLWTTALILCAPPMALGAGGYLSYPIAHNISVLWGLAALMSALIWQRRGGLWALLGMLVLLAVANFSDPWLLPTFDVPLLCSAGLMLWRQKQTMPRYEMGGDGRRWLYLVGAVLVALFLCKTRFLGLLHIGSDNVHSFVKLRFSLVAIPNILGALSYYFNFIPGVTLNKFFGSNITPSGINAPTIVLVMAVNAAVLIFIICCIVRSFLKKASLYNQDIVFLFFFLILSIFGIVASSFIFGSMRHISSSRYLVNIFYAIIMMFLILSDGSSGKYFKNIMFVLAGLWVVSGAWSGIKLWKFGMPAVHTQNMNFVPVLQEEHIDTAYGSYWGAEAHTVTWLSHGAVHLRPLLYEPDYHGFLPSIWTSPTWYKLKPHTRWALILTMTDGNDVCMPFPTCKDAAVNQFGPPVAVRQAERALFLIYDSDRTNIPYDLTVNTWKTPLPLPREEIFSGWKSFYPNARMNRDDLVTVEGWGEPKADKVASTATVAKVGIPVIYPGHDRLNVRFLMSSSTPQHRDVDIRYRGKIVAQWRFGDVTTAGEVTFPIEAGQRFVSCDLLIRNPDKGKHGTVQGVTLSEVQVVDDK